MNLVILLPELKDLPVYIGYGITFALFAIGCILGTVKGIRRWRDNEIKAKASEEAAIQARVDKAVDEVKDQYEQRITILHEQIDGFKVLREQDAERLTLAEARAERLRQEREERETSLAAERTAHAALQGKYATVIDLNLGYQGKITELNAEVKRLGDIAEKYHGIQQENPGS